jgi:MinD-like ATPase involved in chromosome partitioning or flagellar assembly
MKKVHVPPHLTYLAILVASVLFPSICKSNSYRCFEIRLKPLRQVSGVVVNDIGEPIRGATVQILNGSSKVLTVTTDENGRFSVEHLGAGNYQLLARASGYHTSALFPIVVVNPKTTDRRMLQIRLLVGSGCPGIRIIKRK